jgi:hypothetical protein
MLWAFSVLGAADAHLQSWLASSRGVVQVQSGRQCILPDGDSAQVQDLSSFCRDEVDCERISVPSTERKSKGMICSGQNVTAHDWAIREYDATTRASLPRAAEQAIRI